LLQGPHSARIRSFLKAPMSNDRQLRRTVVDVAERTASSNVIAAVIIKWLEIIGGSIKI